MRALHRPWSTKEVARAAGVDESYVRRLCNQGLIAGAYKLGSIWAIPDPIAREWLEQRRKRGSKRGRPKKAEARSSLTPSTSS